MDIHALHKAFISCNGASTDTRKIKIHDMFFALKGENFNGNQFAEKALELGAKYVVIDEESSKLNDNYLLVEDVLSTLQDLGKFHRKYLNTTIIALTGSNGKTTTKELINAVLSKKYKTVATIGNLNNHIGVPLTLLRLKKDTDYGIVEMGANHLNEIEFLCTIAQPDYGMITNFGKAHLEGFGSEEGVIKGKSELYDYLVKNNKTIIADTEDDNKMNLIKSYKGMAPSGAAEVETLNLLESDGNLILDYDGATITTQISGAYNFKNIKYAVAIGEHFHVAKNDIISAIEGYLPDNNRSQIIKRDSNEIIMDAYNANPSSMVAALDSFGKKSGKNKIAILGDMFELGANAEKEHEYIAKYALSKNLNTIYLVGKNFNKVNVSDPKVEKFEIFEDLKSHLQQSKPSDALILIKGSRGMALERTLESI